jgi:hypothetical protein
VSLISKERDKKYRGFYFLYRYGDFTLYFYPALLPSAKEAKELRDIVKSGLTP